MSPLRVRPLLLAALLTLVVAAPSASAGETDTFRFEPVPVGGAARSVFRPALAPGGSASDTARLQNLTDREVTVRVAPADVSVDPDGVVTVAPSGAEPTAAGAWLTVPEGSDAIVLAPRAAVDVPFEVARPADDVAGGTAALVAAEVGDAPAGGGVEVSVRVALLVQVAGEARGGVTLEDVALDVPVSLVPGSATVTATLRNGGTEAVRLTPRAAVTGLTGRVWELVGDPVEVAAGDAAPVTLAWTTVPRLGAAVVPRVEATTTAGAVAGTGPRAVVLPLWLVAVAELAAVRIVLRAWLRERRRA
ncbi:MAG: hypothetical protein ACLGIR_07945 [Actinomycetes bacterium]